MQQLGLSTAQVLAVISWLTSVNRNTGIVSISLEAATARVGLKRHLLGRAIKTLEEAGLLHRVCFEEPGRRAGAYDVSNFLRPHRDPQLDKYVDDVLAVTANVEAEEVSPRYREARTKLLGSLLEKERPVLLEALRKRVSDLEWKAKRLGKPIDKIPVYLVLRDNVQEIVRQREITK